jgi:hypothetical protein
VRGLKQTTNLVEPSKQGDNSKGKNTKIGNNKEYRLFSRPELVFFKIREKKISNILEYQN